MHEIYNFISDSGFAPSLLCKHKYNISEFVATFSYLAFISQPAADKSDINHTSKAILRLTSKLEGKEKKNIRTACIKQNCSRAAYCDNVILGMDPNKAIIVGAVYVCGSNINKKVLN